MDVGVKMDRKYGNIADHTEILKRLQRLIELMEEQNDIMLYDDDPDVRLTNPCCPGCDGNCGEED